MQSMTGAAKISNILLQSLTMYDPHPATMMDLSSQFFLREEDVTMATNR